MKKLILSLFLLFFTASCVETVVVASVAGGVMVVRQKSLEDTKDDVIIAAKIDKELLANGLKSPNNSVAIMVNEGRVLATGTVRDLDKGKRIGQIIWKVKGVKEFIDEVEIDEKGLKIKDFGILFSDSYLTAKVKTKLFFNRKTNASDFKIISQNGAVYLLGIAKNNSQLKETLDVIANSRGVKKVVNHVILANDNRRNG